LDGPRVEAVVICLPTALHAATATAAFEAGKHVYLEKPLAASLEDAGRAVAAWQESGRVGMIGFNYRFNPLVQALRRALCAGRIGRPAGAQTVFTSAGGQREGWRGSRSSGGGVLLDLASHHIDLIRYLFEEEIVEVFARLRSAHTEHDGAALELRLRSGVDVQTLAAYSAVEEDSLSIYGPGGKLKVDRYRGLDVEYTPAYARHTRLRQLGQAFGAAARLPYLWQKRRAPGHEPSYGLALARFCEAAGLGQAASPDLLDGYRSLAVAVAAEESAATGRAVAPPGVGGAAPAA
jgi:predicted dehydrogenase